MAAIPPSLEARLLPYTLVSDCPKAGLGIDRLCEMLVDLLKVELMSPSLGALLYL